MTYAFARSLGLLALSALVTSPALSCKREAPAASHAATEPPVAAPASLVAEGTLRDPDAFWGKLRKGGGAALASMPDSAAGAILGWAGVDPAVAPLVAGTSPFQIALGQGADGLSFAIAMRLGDFAAVRAALVDGETARFRGEEVEGMLRLVPREGPPPRLEVAVTWSGYLVVASTEGDLGTLGAYAARTLPTKSTPSASFELRMDPGALARAGGAAPELAAGLSGFLAVVVRGALPPEVDASAVAACFAPEMRDTIAAAASLAEARVDANADDGRLDAVVDLVPKPGGGQARKRVQTMHPADAAPLLDAPKDAVAAIFSSDAADAREGDAATLGPCLGGALAPILGPGGGAKLASALGAWAHGRGDWETVSFVSRSPAAGFVARAPVKDAAAVTSAMKGFAALASQPSLSDAVRRMLPLRAGQAAPPSGLQTVDVPGVGKASVLMFPPRPPAQRTDDGPSGAPVLAPPGLAWAADAQEVDVALGQSPAELLALARPTETMRSNAPVEHAVKALGKDASFAAVLVPPGCCADGGPTAAPLTLAWGRHGDDGRATLSVGDVILGQIISRLAPR